MTFQKYNRLRKSIKMFFPQLTERQIDELAKDEQFIQWLERQTALATGNIKTFSLNIGLPLRFREADRS